MCTAMQHREAPWHPAVQQLCTCGAPLSAPRTPHGRIRTHTHAHTPSSTPHTALHPHTAHLLQAPALVIGNVLAAVCAGGGQAGEGDGGGLAISTSGSSTTSRCRPSGCPSPSPPTPPPPPLPPTHSTLGRSGACPAATSPNGRSGWGLICAGQAAEQAGCWAQQWAPTTSGSSKGARVGAVGDLWARGRLADSQHPGAPCE